MRLLPAGALALALAASAAAQTGTLYEPFPGPPPPERAQQFAEDAGVRDLSLRDLERGVFLGSGSRAPERLTPGPASERAQPASGAAISALAALSLASLLLPMIHAIGARARA